MQHRFATLFLFLSLFASANRAGACGSNAPTCGQASTEKSCCSQKSGEQSSQCADNSNGCEQNHPGQSCPDDDGCGGCHCPGCGTTCHAPAAFASASEAVSPLFIFAASVQRQAFYFADHLPEAVYLPIWQPPKLGG